MARFTPSVLLAGLLSLGGLSTSALAEEGLSGQIGAGIGYQPHDPSGSRYDTVPLPYLDLDWGDVSLDGDDGLTWDAVKNSGFTAGPFINYLSGRNANGDLRGLRNVPDMAQVGGYVQYAPDDFWRVFVQIGSAVGAGNAQGGLLGKVGGELGYPLGMGIIGSSNLSAHFADARQTRTFFGVTAEEAQASGIEQYKPGGGLQNITLTQNLAIPLGGSWSLMTSASWIHLVGNAADSSIVRERGDNNQGQVQTAISYKF
ncbi:MipA/OmpV family protein [Pseudomonas fuscovaginae UPB0736]|uniref:Outer membrane scaffolding protein for murein synthesis, MipA/OmpV family n=1 Tax=Pseudomonas asplenii TaxID=53407 RepID=A0A1H6N865_9PSED|nr:MULTISPECIES: MipA/OmpV family protein [Pseudomonas]UUQ63390.1 MipA/OmpV family protein [Pseudomonas fuscovaginae UPB0736]UZE28112.1 MipA/OmpV family protein [Pseudomonas asplenii]SDS74600.1 Outer membrane scaffolding protein for murein synthesis, MipA/OmpV family [Pseudomonas asplenii]SEI06323.1 Outer membrane scaffolding protein for murein synthesis, MipA/OmpV family [Pseudomonas fuscovaginae]